MLLRLLSLIFVVVIAGCAAPGVTRSPDGSGGATSSDNGEATSPVASGESTDSEEVIPVSFAWVQAAAQAALPVAISQGFDEDFGIKFEAQGFPSAAEGVQSVVTAVSDGAYGASVPTGPALILQGAPIRIAQIYASGGDRMALVTASDSIQSVEDLAGGTVGTAVGSDPEQFLLKALQAAEVDTASVGRVNMQYSDMAAALVTGQIDAATMVQPTMETFLNAEPSARILERAGEYVSLAGALYMSDETVNSADDLGYRIYLALAKAMQFIRENGADSDAVAGIVAEATGANPEDARVAMLGILFDPRIKEWTITKHQEEMEWYVGNTDKLASVMPPEDLYAFSLQERALEEHPELFTDLDEYLEEQGAPADAYE